MAFGAIAVACGCPNLDGDELAVSTTDLDGNQIDVAEVVYSFDGGELMEASPDCDGGAPCGAWTLELSHAGEMLVVARYSVDLDETCTYYDEDSVRLTLTDEEGCGVELDPILLSVDPEALICQR